MCVCVSTCCRREQGAAGTRVSILWKISIETISNIQYRTLIFWYHETKKPNESIGANDVILAYREGG